MTPARFSVETVSGPASELLLPDAAKAHCRVEHNADDALFAGWIKAARELVESGSGLRLLTQTVAITYAAFPCDGPIELPVSPVQSVSGVSYTDADGDAAALTGYQTWLSHRPPLLLHAAGGSWPAVQFGALKPLTVTAVVGWADAAQVPAQAEQAVKLILGYWNSFRGDGKDPNQYPQTVGIPAGAERLIGQLRRREYR